MNAMRLLDQLPVEFNSAAGSVRHDVHQFRNARDGLAHSGIRDSASASPNHAGLVATSGTCGNHHERGVVDSNGVQYSVNIPTYSHHDYRTRGRAGQNEVQFSVNAHHFDHNRNIGHDAIPITYAPLGLDVSRGSIRSAIPIGFDPPGLDVSRGSGRSAIPSGYDHHGADGRYQSPGAGASQGSHNASGSTNSPDSNRGRHGGSMFYSAQLIRDLSGMMSSPEGARQAFQIPAGGAGTFLQEIDEREENGRQDRPGEFACSMDHGPIDSAPGVAFERTSEMCERDHRGCCSSPMSRVLIST
jgi:hypothetical protein